MPMSAKRQQAIVAQRKKREQENDPWTGWLNVPDAPNWQRTDKPMRYSERERHENGPSASPKFMELLAKTIKENQHLTIAELVQMTGATRRQVTDKANSTGILLVREAGKAARGAPRAFDKEKVAAIRAEYAKGGTTQRQLAAKHGVAQGLIGTVLRGVGAYADD